jgi:tRNA U38,U39,U40 pseudouridine synthase TruA
MFRHGRRRTEKIWPVKRVKSVMLVVCPNRILSLERGKRYRYRVSLVPVMHPLQRMQRWHPPWAETVNVTILNRVLQLYVGTHDFRAFWQYFHIQGALYKQIRNLVGLALDVARGVVTEDDVVQLLQPGHG